MITEVTNAIVELENQFGASKVIVNDDGQGGARIVIESISIGKKYSPDSTWVGFHITAQYPYADIYPVFIGGDVKRVDGAIFSAPITHGYTFEDRSAIQISKRNSAAGNGKQKATLKILKIIDFLETLP